MLGIYGVARSEAVTVVEFLSDVQKSIMNPKHRLSIDITRTYLKVLEDINLVDKNDIDDPEFARFGSATVDFLTTLHVVLRDQTTHHLRNKTYKKYIEHYIDYAPADVQEKV
jgi:UDP-glucose 6-dehydrogenase